LDISQLLWVLEISNSQSILTDERDPRELQYFDLFDWEFFDCSWFDLVASYNLYAFLLLNSFSILQVLAIVVGNILATIFVILNSVPGAYYHVGFPVVNRYVWGMYGSSFVIWNRILLSLGKKSGP